MSCLRKIIYLWIEFKGIYPQVGLKIILTLLKFVEIVAIDSGFNFKINIMKNLKSNSKTTVTILFFFFLCITTSIFAQNAKMIEMKGTDQLRFSVENIEATSGQKITVKLGNDSKFQASAMSHNFVLLKKSTDVEAFDKASTQHPENDYIAPELEDQIIAYTGMAGGGGTVEVTFNAPTKPGKYTYICTFPGHFSAGMKGVLTVK